MSRARGCIPCAISLVSGAEVGTTARLARNPAVRVSETLHQRCPDCATRLTRLLLEWEGVGQARIEECGYCALLVVSGAESVQVAAIVEQTRGLDDEMMERLIELARSSAPPDPPSR